MNWFQRIIGYVPVAERKGIKLDKSYCWEVESWIDIEAEVGDESDKSYTMYEDFLRALVILAPEDSILYSEYYFRPDYEVRLIFDENRPEKIAKVQLKSGWRPRYYHMNITEDTLNKLAEIVTMYPIFGLILKFVVYQENNVLIEWEGNYDSSVFISKEISSEKVSEFCDKLGTRYKEYDQDIF